VLLNADFGSAGLAKPPLVSGSFAKHSWVFFLNADFGAGLTSAPEASGTSSPKSCVFVLKDDFSCIVGDVLSWTSIVFWRRADFGALAEDACASWVVFGELGSKSSLVFARKADFGVEVLPSLS
jgi:hypothetical protein